MSTFTLHLAHLVTSTPSFLDGYDPYYPRSSRCHEKVDNFEKYYGHQFPSPLTSIACSQPSPDWLPELETHLISLNKKSSNSVNAITPLQKQRVAKLATIYLTNNYISGHFDEAIQKTKTPEDAIAAFLMDESTQSPLTVLNQINFLALSSILPRVFNKRVLEIPPTLEITRKANGSNSTK